jgi:hypothetical protein
MLSLVSTSASAHCDTMDGPVIAAARAPLQAGDVTPVLKWIPKQSEREIRAAFTRILKVRAGGAEARELVDKYFFETLLRLHQAVREYTGLKPVGTPIDPGRHGGSGPFERTGRSSGPLHDRTGGRGHLATIRACRSGSQGG